MVPLALGPSPHIERTAKRLLRGLWSVAQVERQADMNDQDPVLATALLMV